jgi:hypothetical protein
VPLLVRFSKAAGDHTDYSGNCTPECSLGACSTPPSMCSHVWSVFHGRAVPPGMSSSSSRWGLINKTQESSICLLQSISVCSLYGNRVSKAWSVTRNPIENELYSSSRQFFYHRIFLRDIVLNGYIHY